MAEMTTDAAPKSKKDTKFKPGVNPREQHKGKHRERGPKKFTFTYADIAKACGLKVNTVREYAQRKDGPIDMTEFESVIRFCADRMGIAEKAVKAHKAELKRKADVAKNDTLKIFKELEALLQFGLILKGAMPSGLPVIECDIPSGEAFRPIKTRVSRGLENAGYVRGWWTLNDGAKVEGWTIPPEGC